MFHVQPFIYPFIHSFNHSFIHSIIHSFNHSFIQSFIHSFIRIHLFPVISIAPFQLCQSFTLKRHRYLRAKDLPKVHMWRLEWDSNLRPSARKAANLPLSHHAPQQRVARIRWAFMHFKTEPLSNINYQLCFIVRRLLAHSSTCTGRNSKISLGAVRLRHLVI